MFTKRFYPIYQTINWTRRYIFYFIIISLLPFLLKKFWAFELLYIPWLPIALIGTAVAFYLGFKNNASYERLWEARKIYGSIVNNSRTFANYINNYITNQFRNNELSYNELKKIKYEFIKRHIAWLTALRYQLRTDKKWEHQNKENKYYRKYVYIEEHEINIKDKLNQYLTQEEINNILSKTNPALHLVEYQFNELNKVRKDNLVDDFRFIEIGNVLRDLVADQGKAERIKNFPFPRQYASLNIYFVWLFIFLLPFGMLPEFEKLGTTFDWLSIPFCVIISWVFHTMEMIGDHSENPFEGSVNDVPITQMSYSIEKDILELINQEQIDKFNDVNQNFIL